VDVLPALTAPPSFFFKVPDGGSQVELARLESTKLGKLNKINVYPSNKLPPGGWLPGDYHETFHAEVKGDPGAWTMSPTERQASGILH
jgi:hypothetical protein